MRRHPAPRHSAYHKPQSVEELTQRNVQTISQLEVAARNDRTRAEAVVEHIVEFCGRLPFVYFHAIWFGAWIGFNVLSPRHLHFDPFPFQFLTLTVSLEAIFLSLFILVSQNRQARLDSRRNELELQINLLAEQENSKMLCMLERIAHRVDADISGDPDVKVLAEATRPETLLEQIDAVQRATDARVENTKSTR